MFRRRVDQKKFRSLVKHGTVLPDIQNYVKELLLNDSNEN